MTTQLTKSKIIKDAILSVRKAFLYATNVAGIPVSKKISEFTEQTLLRKYSHQPTLCNETLTILSGISRTAATAKQVITLILQGMKKEGFFDHAIRATVDNLTPDEIKVLEYLCLELATWRDSEPGYSCVGGTDITKHFKWAGKTTSGLVSSLTRKRFVYSDDQFPDILYPLWYMIPKSFGRLAPSVEAPFTPPPALKHFTDKLVLGTPEKKPWKKVIEARAKAIADSNNIRRAQLVKFLGETKPPVVGYPYAHTAAFEKVIGKKKPAKSVAIVANKKYKPYEKFGAHGHNVTLEGFTENCIVEFLLKGVRQLGKFRHFHINNQFPKGYGVINHDGKIIERANGKFKLYAGEPKKAIKVANLVTLPVGEPVPSHPLMSMAIEAATEAAQSKKIKVVKKTQATLLNEALDKIQGELLLAGMANLAKVQKKAKRLDKKVPSTGTKRFLSAFGMSLK